MEIGRQRKEEVVRTDCVFGRTCAFLERSVAFRWARVRVSDAVV
jgi:hypothetical protein